MFSGLTNQISGWVANKTGGAPVDPNDPNAQQQPVDPNYVQNGAEGEVPVEGDPNAQPGGVAGMAQGFLAKAMAAKDGVKEKASAFQPPNLGNLGGGVVSNVMNMIPGRAGGEEQVPDPAQQVDPNYQGQIDPSQQQYVDPSQQQYVDPNQQQYQQ